MIIDDATITDWIQQEIKNTVHLKLTVDNVVQSLITNMLDQLMQDQAWINKIQSLIEYNVVTKTSDMILGLDIKPMVADQVRLNFDQWRQELEEQLLGHGIQDTATHAELVITDGSVVAQNGLGCGHMLVENDLVTKNLVVTGTINTDCVSWDELRNTIADRTQSLLGESWRASLTQQVLDLAREQGIDFQDITLAGAPLVSGPTLNPSIKHSALERVGTLQDLTVKGTADLAQTIRAHNHRVGINTDSPDMALTIWDEEISVSIGKRSQDRAWLGPSRNHALDIGVNRKRALSIEPDGLVVVDRLRVDRWRISFGNAVPNYSGTRGDLVINHDPKPGTPWAWQCLGAFQWQPMRTV
jgi:hypothetical protein